MGFRCHPSDADVVIKVSSGRGGLCFFPGLLCFGDSLWAVPWGQEHVASAGSAPSAQTHLLGL